MNFRGVIQLKIADITIGMPRSVIYGKRNPLNILQQNWQGACIMAEIDIRALTKEAEAGNGCAVQKQLEPLSFEESLKTLKQIANQNKTDRDADPSVARITYNDRASGDIASGNLSTKAPSDWVWHYLVGDRLYLDDTSNNKLGARKFDCNDIP